MVGNRRLAQGVSDEVEIIDGQNTYLLGYFPDANAIGEVLTSSRPTR
jgi:hypothetical protein